MDTATSERAMQQEVQVGREQAARVVQHSSWAQVAGGVGVVTLAILGLLGIVPTMLLGVAAACSGRPI
jgi:cell division protein FtsX